MGSATGDIEWIPLIPGFSGFLPASPTATVTGPGQGGLARARTHARTAESQLIPKSMPPHDHEQAGERRTNFKTERVELDDD